MSQKEIDKFEALLLLLFITALGIVMLLCIDIGYELNNNNDTITVKIERTEEELADWKASARYYELLGIDYEALLDGRGLVGE